MTTKTVPQYIIDKEKRRGRKRGGKNPANGIERGKKYANALKELNVHRPANITKSRHLQTMRELKDYLRETWALARETVDDFQSFSRKQIAFARHYAKNGRTNKSAAARLAGYDSANPNVILEMANRNLRLPYMEELIQAFEFEEKARMKITVEDVVAWFNKIATQAMETGDFTNANRAMENLAKYLGMFVEKKEITHKVIHSKEELDARIAELTQVLKDSEDEIERRLGIGS